MWKLVIELILRIGVSEMASLGRQMWTLFFHMGVCISTGESQREPVFLRGDILSCESRVCFSKSVSSWLLANFSTLSNFSYRKVSKNNSQNLSENFHGQLWCISLIVHALKYFMVIWHSNSFLNWTYVLPVNLISDLIGVLP